MTRHDLIRKLVTTGHLNVPERNGLGSSPIRRAELLSAIREVLTETGYFPPHARPWHAGAVCYEGSFIEKTDDGYRLHRQRAVATDPRQLAQATHEEFSTVEAVIDAYIEREIGAEIDGLAMD